MYNQDGLHYTEKWNLLSKYFVYLFKTLMIEKNFKKEENIEISVCTCVFYLVFQYLVRIVKCQISQ